MLNSVLLSVLNIIFRFHIVVVVGEKKHYPADEMGRIRVHT